MESNYICDIVNSNIYQYTNRYCLMHESDIFTYAKQMPDGVTKIMTYNVLTNEIIEEGEINDSVNFAYLTKNKNYLFYNSKLTYGHFIKWDSKEVVTDKTNSLDYQFDISVTGKFYKTQKEIVNSDNNQIVYKFDSTYFSCKWADNDKVFIIQDFDRDNREYKYTIYNITSLDSLYCLTTDPVHGKFLSIPSPVFEIIHDRYLLLEYEDSTFLLFDIVNLRKVEEFTYPHGIVQISGFTSDLVYCYGYCDEFFTVWRTGLPNAVVEQPEAKTTSEISVSPNPAADYVSLNVASGGRLLLKLYNFGGNFVMDYANDYYSSGEGFRLDVSALPQGIYYIKAYIDNEFLGEEKFVIVR